MSPSSTVDRGVARLGAGDGVVPGPLDRAGVALDGGDARAGVLVRDRQRDRARPDAQVDDDRARRCPASRSSAQPVSCSVSGRGTKTPGPTASSRNRNGARPVRCCSGTRSARWSTSVPNRTATSSGTVDQRQQPARGRRRAREASSSSASTRGDSTPASASRRAASASSDADVQEPAASSSAVCAAVSASMTASRSPSMHLVEVVGLVADAVVGDPVLREVVGAHPLAAVHRAHLAAPLVAGGGVGLLAGGGEQPGAQHAQRGLAVLQLALLVLRADHDAAGQVGDPDGGVGGVHALPAGARRAEDVDAQVVRVDADVDLLGLGQHEDAGRGGVDAALALGDRHPLHAVHAALELQPRPDALVACATSPRPRRPCSRRGRTRRRRGSRWTSRGARRSGGTCAAGRRRTAPTPRRPPPP